jgi:hypothetical protein
MKYILLLVASIFLFDANSQNTKHVFFGLDMDLDWYSLTGYDGATYYRLDTDSSTTYVVTDIDFYLNQVDIEIEKFNFSEYLIAFNKGATKKTRLENVSPFMFIGRNKYPNNNSFNEKGFQDVEFLKNKLMKFYGEPQLKIEKPEFRAYKWENNEVTIILNSLRNELMTSLNYIVNSR